MEELLQYRRHLLAELERSVEVLGAAWGALPPEKRHASLCAKGHTPHWVLANLRAIESGALSVRLNRILTEDCPHITLFVEEDWMAAHYSPAEPAEDILADYARLRATELAWLQELPPQGWNRTGRHPWFGVRTLQWWAERCLAYAREHLQQLPG